MPIIVDKWITVLESARNPVGTNILLRNNDWIDISASGSIWAGVWFTGENGPRGWAGVLEMTVPFLEVPRFHC
jgi:hypothetical protein